MESGDGVRVKLGSGENVVLVKNWHGETNTILALLQVRDESGAAPSKKDAAGDEGATATASAGERQRKSSLVNSLLQNYRGGAKTSSEPVLPMQAKPAAENPFKRRKEDE